MDQYSGLNSYLGEIYYRLNREVGGDNDQKTSMPPTFRSQRVMKGVKEDYLQKLKDV